MARKPKPPKGYISLSDAVNHAARNAFSKSKSPEQSARDWLFEEICCGWQVPIVGCRKVRIKHWHFPKKSIETGAFDPLPEVIDFRDPEAWQALAGEPLFLGESEYELPDNQAQSEMENCFVLYRIRSAGRHEGTCPTSRGSFSGRWAC